MRKIFILFIYLSLLQTLYSQNMKFEDICEIACANFDNINKKHTKSIRSNGFNFRTMKEENNSLYNNVFVNSCYNGKELVRIEVVDTLNMGRNFDIDIIFKSNKFYLGTIFFWDNSERKGGNFSSGFFLNDKVNLKTYLIERNYVNFVITDKEIENPKEIFPYNAKPEYFFHFVSSIKMLDKKLFVKYDLEFKYRKFISYSKYEYIKNEINESRYIINDKIFPYYFLEKYTINDIYKLFTIISLKYNYQKNIIVLKKSSIYYKDKPLWIYE